MSSRPIRSLRALRARAVLTATENLLTFNNTSGQWQLSDCADSSFVICRFVHAESNPDTPRWRLARILLQRATTTTSWFRNEAVRHPSWSKPIANSKNISHPVFGQNLRLSREIPAN